MTITVAEPLNAPGRVVLRCHEYGRIDTDPADVLSPDGRLVLVPGILNQYVRADFTKDNELRLSALGVTGLIPLTNRIAIQIRPRFPLRNLTHMVSVCGYTPTVLPALRDYQSTDLWDEWLLDVMADGLLAAIDTIRLNGLLRTYRQRTEGSSFPHGRIDTTATVLQYASRGISHQARYSWFERTVDNPPNRCLKGAVAFLHQRYAYGARRRGVRERIARLGDALRLLGNVTIEARPHSLNDDQVRGIRPLPETRAYYRSALDLAVAILTRRGISLDAPTRGDVSLSSLLVKTEDLFEDFVRLSLEEFFSDHPRLSVLDGNKDEGRMPLYERVSEARKDALPKHTEPSPGIPIPDAEPDVVFRLDDGTHPLIADVKYTNVRDYANRAEVEQIVLYGLRYKSPVVMTIHPKRPDTRKGLVLAGSIGPIVVAQYRVDLAADDLTAEMDEMANEIRSLIESPSPSASARPPTGP